MTSGRTGGLLVSGAGVLMGISGAVGATGGSVGIGGTGAASLALYVAFGVAGLGAAVLAYGGQGALHGRTVRIGLGILAVGLLATLIASILSGAAAPIESQQGAILLIIGVPVSLLGFVTTGLSLLRTRGWGRAVGALPLAGTLAAILAIILSDAPPAPVVLLAIATVLFIGGVFGLGLLAIQGDAGPEHRLG